VGEVSSRTSDANCASISVSAGASRTQPRPARRQDSRVRKERTWQLLGIDGTRRELCIVKRALQRGIMRPRQPFSSEGECSMPLGIAIMPQSVSEVFEPLKGELVHLHERWALFRRVFGLDEARIDLLNRYSPIFFGYAQWAMYLDVILALCRYTDPEGEVTKKGFDRRKCTLDRLVNAVTADDAAFGSALATNEWAAVKNCRDRDFKEIRDERIAHNDFTTMMARFNGNPVGWPSREQVGHFLTLCTDLMGRVQLHYVRCPFVFDFNAYDGERSADKLVNVLVEFAKRHEADVAAGKAMWMIRPPKDWLNPRGE
jgi:hypothetical protein